MRWVRLISVQLMDCKSAMVGLKGTRISWITNGRQSGATFAALQWTVSAVCIWSLGAGIMSLQGSQSRCRFWGGDTTFLWWTINCVLSSSIALCCPRWLICLFENGLFGWHAHLATIFFGKVWQATHCVVNNLLHCRKKIKLWQCTQFLKNCGIL